MESGEMLIAVDRKLVAPVFLDELDQLMASFELRGEYATEIGRALAEQDDRQLLQLAYKAARTPSASSPTSDHPDGTLIFDTNMGTTIATLIRGIRAAAITLDTNDIPEEGRVCALTPEAYAAVIADGSVIDKDFAMENGDRGKGIVKMLHGFELIKTNNLPNGQNITYTAGNTGDNRHSFGGGPSISPDQNDYSGNFLNSVAVCFHPQALGTVQLQGVQTSVKWYEEYQAWMLLGKQAVGHGILRPGAAVELHAAGAAPTFGGNEVALTDAAYDLLP